MISRYLGAGIGLARAAVLVVLLMPVAAWAQGPSYTYIGLNYEWTDVKYGVNPNSDPNFNGGDIEVANLDVSLGLLPFMFIAAQTFDGICKGCSIAIDSNGDPMAIDMDFEGFKVGLGGNINLTKAGTTDFVIRVDYLDVDLDRSTVPPSVPPTSMSNITGDGFAGTIQIRSQISEKAEVMVGYSYQQIDQGGGMPTLKNRDMLVGVGYRVTKGLSLLGNAIVFDDDTGFNLGIRYYFDTLWKRDSIAK